ncbi:MAG: TetR/AcrR family transcriptional regulator [Novosphingobium sp.]|nr:TetR/AcrR family transcriptional regulator [Novosphingobium sp.]
MATSATLTDSSPRPARRVGGEGSVTRAAILTAAEHVMRDEGYAAASTRRVAARAGLKPSLVHYYFPTTDDLLLALFEKGAAESDAGLEAALAAPDPLRALWAALTDTSRTALALEFMALANHRPGLRARIAEHSERMRARQVTLFDHALGERLAAEGACPAAGLSVVLAGIGRALIMEGALGVTGGHAEARAWVEAWLDKLAPAGAPRRD